MKYRLSTRITCALLSLVMMFLFIPLNVYAAIGEGIGAISDKLEKNEDVFATKTLTYIYTAEDLQKIGKDEKYPLSGSYILMNDIDLSGISNWTPIGDESNPFTGKLLGAGFTISGMQIKTLPEVEEGKYAYAGLFGYNKGLIRDLCISGGITASTEGKKAFVGSIAGYNDGVIDHCMDEVSYGSFKLDENSLYPAEVIDLATAPSLSFTVGSQYAVKFTGTTASAVNITVQDSDFPAVYIFLENVNVSSFNLTYSGSTKEVYFVSTGASNTLKAQNNKEAINVSTSLTILGNAPITIYADDASHASAVSGNSGNNGKPGNAGANASYVAVKVGTLTVDMDNSEMVSIYGGRGGDGSDGTAGLKPSGTDAATGGTGGKGGAGGTGGTGLQATYIKAYTALHVYSGNGGDGGDGGQGGQGGKGGKGSSPTFGDGGKGGKGGTGGLGGVGGKGGDVSLPITGPAVDSDILGLVYQIFGTTGAPGAGAKGGAGGPGGDGGNGGLFGSDGSTGDTGTSKTGTISANGAAGTYPGTWRVRADNGQNLYYLYAKNDITYSQARSEANGPLISINSAEEQAVAQEMQRLSGIETLWIGLERAIASDPDADMNSWVWFDGGSLMNEGPYSYNNWGVGEPNNAYDQEWNAHLSANGYWNDINAEAGGINGYITEASKTCKKLTGDAPRVYDSICGYYGPNSYVKETDINYIVPNFYNLSTLNKYGNAYYLPTDNNGGNPYAVLVAAIGTPSSVSIHPDTEYIYSYAFRAQASITAVVIPKNVYGIGTRAFYNCSSLARLTANGSLKVIGQYAFSESSKLREVTLPERMMRIENNAFSLCTSLTSFYIPDGLEKIDTSTFSSNKNLRSVSIPESVTSINQYAFSYCSQLVDVTFRGNSGLKNIDMGAFQKCSSLEKIDFPESLETISATAFQNATSLKELHIPKNVKTIAGAANFFGILATWGAFFGASSLEKITVDPENKTFRAVDNALYKINEECGEGCTKEHTWSLVLGSKNTILRPEDEVLEKYGATAPVNSEATETPEAPQPHGKTSELPLNVTKIASHAFANVNLYNPLTVDNGITLEKEAFYNASGDFIILQETDFSEAFKNCNEAVIFTKGSVTDGDEAKGIHKIHHSGQAGENAYYILYAKDGEATLFVYGSGSTYDYEKLSLGNHQTVDLVTINGEKYTKKFINAEINSALSSTKLVLKYIIVDNGIDTIGTSTFYGLMTVDSVEIGSDVKKVKEKAFDFSVLEGEALSNIYFAGDCPEIDKNAILLNYNSYDSASKRLTITYNFNSHGWTKNGAPYLYFVCGEGLTTKEPTLDPSVKAYFPVLTNEDLNFVSNTSGYDKYGIKYELLKETTVNNGDGTTTTYRTAKVVGFRPQHGVTDITIPLEILMSGNRYKVVEISGDAFKDVTALNSITVRLDSSNPGDYEYSGVSTIGAGAFTGCTARVHLVGNRASTDDKYQIKVDAAAFGTGSYVVVDDTANGWTEGADFGGATVYISSVLTGYTDSQGIYYTVDLKNKTAIVGKKTDTTDENAENVTNTSGAKIKDVKIKNFVTYNGEIYMIVGFDRYAFYSNNTVETITFDRFIGEGQSEDTPAIWDCTFRNTDSLVSITANGNPYYVTKVDGNESGILFGNPLNPDDKDHAIYTRLIKYPENKSASSFTVPSSGSIMITSIEKYAFAGNSQLESITLNGVNVIGSHAFWNCTNLTNLDGDYQIHDLEDSAFENTAITSFRFSDTLSTIGARAFYNTNLGKGSDGAVKINDNIVSIGEGAFGRCLNVTSFSFENATTKEAFTQNVLETLKTDRYSALYAVNGDGTYTLLQFPAMNGTSVVDFIPDEGMTEEQIALANIIVPYSISSEAFYGAAYVQRIVLNDATVLVGSQAFANCKRLERVTLGAGYYGTSEDTVAGLYSYNLFIDSGALEYIEVSLENENFANDSNGALYSKSFDTLYCYPAGIQRVNYNIPASVTKIYDSAFYGNTSIKQIVVGTADRLTIGSRAFGSCTNLQSVFYVSEYIPTVAEKIYDNANPGLTSYYKDKYSSSDWGVIYGKDGSKWCERDILAYSAISSLPNDTIKTNDYLLYVKGTDNVAIEGVYVIVTVYTTEEVNGESVRVPHKFYLTTDEYGRVSFSTLEDGVDASNIHVYAAKDGYFPYDYDMHLDMDMLVSYLTIAKEPDVFGAECEGKDINSTSVDLNISQYRETFEIADIDENGNPTGNKSQGATFRDISLTVLGFWDQAYANPTFTLMQGDRVLVATTSVEGNACTFTFSAKELTPLVPLEVRLTVTHSSLSPEAQGYELSCRKVLNINVIDFEIKDEDVNLEFGEHVSLGGDGNPLATIFQTMFGSDGFEIELGKNVKFNTAVDGSKITFTLSGSKSFGGKGDSDAACKEGYYKYCGAHNKGTYFFQYTDGLLTYNIRFAPTDVNDYFYYRVYIYHGLPGINYPEAFIKEKAVYGAVNISDSEAALKGRNKVAARSLAILADAKNWIAETYFKDQAKKEKLIKELMEGKIGLFEVDKMFEDLGKETEYKGYKPLWQENYDPDNTKGDGTAKNSHNFELGFEGQLVFEYDRSGIKLSSGSIKGTISYKFKHNSQYMIWVIPVTLEIEVGIDGSATLKLKFDEGVDIESLQVKIQADITASLGVGCVVASVGLYGGLGSIFILDILPEFEVNTWEVHGDFGAYVKILWHKEKFEIWSGKHYFIGGEDSQSAYQLRRKAAMFIADNYEYSPDCNENATIVELDGTIYKIHFATVDTTANPEYDLYNCTKLCYSVWGGTDWGEPVIINDDGYSDASYSLFEDDGNLYIVFTHQTKKLSASDAANTYASAEGLAISYVEITNGLDALISGNIATVEGTTSNYKYAEDITVYKNSAVIAWAENADNNIFGVSPSNRYDEANNVSEVYKTDANSIWVTYETTTVCLASGLSTVIDLEIHEDKIYYIVDRDGDLTDNSDCTLYSISYLENTEAVAYNSTGSITSIESNDGRLMYYYSDATKEGVCFIDGEDTLPEITTQLKDGYVTLVDEAGELYALLYLENKSHTDESGEIIATASCVMAIFKNGDAWGEPVCIYDAYEYSALVQEDRNIYISSFDAHLDDNRIILCLQLCDNSGTTLSLCTRVADTNDIKYSYTYEIDYKAQTVTFTVTNNGATAITASGIEGEILSGCAKEITLPALALTSGVTLTATNGVNTESINIAPISAKYVDLKPLAKQMVVGESNSLLVGVRNYGNEKASAGGKLYVLPGALTDDVNPLTKEELSDLLGSAMYVVELDEIGAGRIAYYEVMLDESILGGVDGVITLYVEYEVNEEGAISEPESVRADNRSAFYLSCISQTVKGNIEEATPITPEITVDKTEIYDFETAPEIEFTVVSEPGYTYEVTVDGTTLTEDTDYRVISVNNYVSNIILSSDYLSALTAGNYTVVVRLTKESEEVTEQFTLTVIAETEIEADKYVTVEWVVTNPESPADTTTVTTQVKDGLAPIYHGTNPYLSGFTFLGWDGPDADTLPDEEFSLVVFDESAENNTVTYTAVFEKEAPAPEIYTITFVIWSNKQDESVENPTKRVVTVEEGKLPTAPTSFGSKAIIGWTDANGNDKEIANATENTTYYAKYSLLLGEVTLEGILSVAGYATVNTLGITAYDALSYQWYVDGVKVEGETLATYEIRPEDMGKSIYCAVSDTGNYIGTLKSNTVTVSRHEHPMAYFAGVQETCEQNGNIEFWFCQTCNKYFSNADATVEITKVDTVIQKKGHSYTDTVVAPTCLTDGYTVHTCDNCSYSYTDTPTTATGHNMSEWAETLKPNCTDTGTDTRVCQRTDCSYTETRIVEKLGHDFDEEFTVDLAATCYSTGSKSRHCSVCGATTEVTVIPMIAHTMGEWVETLAPTCTDKGTEERVCTNGGCTYKETRTVEKLGHNMSEWAETLKPNCTDTGTDTRVCQRTDCNYTETRIVEKLGHDFDEEFTVDLEATCYSTGSKSKHCSVCGAKTEITVIPMTAHTMGEWTEVLAPNCTDKGTEERVCTNDGCTYKETRTVEKLGHNMGEWAETLKPNCTDAGTDTRVCQRTDCNYTETRIVEKLGHDFDEEFTVDLAATCYSTGSKSKHCSVCGAKTEITVIPMTAHTMGEWTEVLAPNCTDNGTDERVCANDGCTYKETRIVEKLGHDFDEEYTVDVEATCDKAGTESRHCTRCTATTDSREIAKIAHKYDTGKVTLEPTAATEGIKTYTCKDCGHSYTEKIDKLAPEIIEQSKEVFKEWTGKETITFRSNASYSDFVEVRINGVVLDRSLYTIREGSIIVELNPEYMDSLENGDYKLEIVSTGGSAATDFSVNKKAIQNPWVWGSGTAVLSLGLLAFAIWLVFFKKKWIVIKFNVKKADKADK